MPDLIRMNAWTCCTNTSWTIDIPGSKGAWYKVAFGRMPPTHPVQYDWTCNCRAYQFGSGKHCKHILAVKGSGKRCGWNAELEPTAQALAQDDGHVCPRCNGPVESIQVAV